MLRKLVNGVGYVAHLFHALVHIVLYVYEYVVLGTEGSYPGDPIKKPLTRIGRWPKKSSRIVGGWKFACDVESEEITNRKFGMKYLMSGESVGRQIWYKEGKEEEDGDDARNDDGKEEFTFSAYENPNSSDKLFRALQEKAWKGIQPDETTVPTTARECARKGLQYYQMLQCEDGHWAGDYGGPMFLMPGLITVLYITKSPLEEYKRLGMIEYLCNHQQCDGGWGTHIECASTMFGTILSYISLRLLGVSPDEDFMKAGRAFIHQHGGALYAPSWAKFWMAVLGVYHWDGINSIPAELFLLPEWFPFHPGKLWCHCRMVYLPMCYIYCKRYTPDVASDPLLMALRKELYTENYDLIVWDDFRQTCAEIDEYSKLNPVMKVAQDFCSWYEYFLQTPLFAPFRALRESALNFVIEYIHAEDIQTNFIDIGPVNKSLNMLCVFVEELLKNTANRESQSISLADIQKATSIEQFQRHLMRVDDYLWTAEDGVKMQGYNGSQCWDTSFTAQAIVEGDFAAEFSACSQKVYKYLDRCQIKENEENKDRYYRHESKGGWPFSTSGHGWPISDCTSEGLKAVLAFHSPHLQWKFSSPNESDANSLARISDERLFDAVNVILTLHNTDGGWATYEQNRGARWYEMMNPSEVFGDIMIDYSYVECTSACITALHKFSKSYPEHRATDVLNAIQAGRRFLKAIQREDGSWYGSWGVCFIYGTWFGIEGLIAAGESVSSPHIQSAAKFLLSKQNPNGGWGESYVACVNKSFPASGTGEGFGEDGSGVVQTAWAMLGLLAAECQDHVALRRGMQYLLAKQQRNGDWLQEGITGVFNRSCGITYTAYRNVFPIWALARYANTYEGAKHDSS